MMTLIATLYNHTFTVIRPSRASDGQGGWDKTPVEVGEVEGRMRPASAAEREVALQRRAEISHVLYCAATSDIARGDTVMLDGQTWRVVAIREPSLAGHHLEIDCLETQIGGQS